MMYPEAFDRAVGGLRNLPGVGEKAAIRHASALLRGRPENLGELIAGLIALRDEIGRCPECGFLAQKGRVCKICASPKRSAELCCVVATPADLEAIERSGGFTGKYYVLGATLDPRGDIESFKTAVDGLKRELRRRNAKEVVLGFNPDVEGESTMAYLIKALTPMGLRVTRPAVGIPVTGEIEFAGAETMRRAMEHRQAFS